MCGDLQNGYEIVSQVVAEREIKSSWYVNRKIFRAAVLFVKFDGFGVWVGFRHLQCNERSAVQVYVPRRAFGATQPP